MTVPAKKKSKSPVKKKRTREPLSRARALEVAVVLADAEGIDAVSMRTVAAALGVEAMSLYHHVANKADLLDGMVDVVFAELPVPVLVTDWQAAMRLRAQQVRAMLHRHRWALGLMGSRATPGLATLRHHDAVLGCLRAAGFSIPLTAHAYSALDAYIFGFVLVELQLPFDSGQGEVVDESQAHAVIAAMQLHAMPHLSELAREHVTQPGYRYADEFGFGLELVIDGLERTHLTERARTGC
jgi:AcrR family transcriptional regulator